MDIPDYKNRLKKSLCDQGIIYVFSKLSTEFNRDSSNYNTLLLLIAEHKDLDRRSISGTIEETTEMFHLTRLRGKLLRFLDILGPEDFVFQSYPVLNIEEIGSKELPLKYMAAIGKMTPEIVAERMAKLRDSLRGQALIIENASHQKEILARRAKNKLAGIGGVGVKDGRLVKRYMNDWVAAFKELDNGLSSFSQSLDATREDIAIICLYNIEYAFAHHGIDPNDFAHLIDIVDLLISEYGDMANTLAKKIEEEELSRFKIGLIGKAFGFAERVNKYFATTVILHEAIIKFIIEWQTIRKLMIEYNKNMNS